MKKHYLFTVKLFISLIVFLNVLSLSPVKAVNFYYPNVLNDSNEHVRKGNLFKNWPNPFNPTTKIRFEVPGSGTSTNVKLVVYNSAGEEVQSLVNREMTPGVYEVEFDPVNLTSGVYFYSLITKDFVKTERMIYVK